MIDSLSNAWFLQTVRDLATMDAEADIARRRVVTGEKINSAKDNGGLYAVAQNIRSDEIGFRTQLQSLDRARGVIDIAIAGVEAVFDLVIDMRSEAVALADASLDAPSRAQKQAAYVELFDQAVSVVRAAEFAGFNLIDGSVATFTNLGLDRAIAGYDVEAALTGVGASDLGGALSASFAGVESPNPDGSGTAAEYLAIAGRLEELGEGLGVVSAALGTTMETVRVQDLFLNEMADVSAAGRGALIDADISVEMAKLRSLEVRRELGAQFIPLSGRGPEAILRLFA